MERIDPFVLSVVEPRDNYRDAIFPEREMGPRLIEVITDYIKGIESEWNITNTIVILPEGTTVWVTANDEKKYFKLGRRVSGGIHIFDTWEVDENTRQVALISWDEKSGDLLDKVVLPFKNVAVLEAEDYDRDEEVVLEKDGVWVKIERGSKVKNVILDIEPAFELSVMLPERERKRILKIPKPKRPTEWNGDDQDLE